MLSLKGFWLRSYGLWRSVDFAFQPGMVLITGRNKSGKTMLFRSVSQVLRAQMVRRGSSLSRLPKGAKIGLDFSVDGVDWSTTLSSTLLTLNKAGADQGSTGKNVARELLAKTLSIPSELFDSTIHVQGNAPDPLIHGTPGSKLAWVSSVLDLTDAYDLAAIRIATDLERATAAASQLEVLRGELLTIEIPRSLPKLNVKQAALLKYRKQHKKYSAGVVLLDQMRKFGAIDTRLDHLELLKNQVKNSKAGIVKLRQMLQDAQAYEAETERAVVVAKLKAQLEYVPVPSGASAQQLNAFCTVLQSLEYEVRDLRDRWHNTVEDRKLYSELKATLAAAPADLQRVIRETQSVQDAASKQIVSLRHVHGKHCPVCQAKLTSARRDSLIVASNAAIAEATKQLRKLEKFEQARGELSRLEFVVADVSKPPPIDLKKLSGRFYAEARNASKTKKIKQRLKDLRTAVGTDLKKPVYSSEVLSNKLTSAETELHAAQLKVERARRIRELRSELSAHFGPKPDYDEIRRLEHEASRNIERLIVEITQAEATIETAARDTARKERIEQQIAKLAKRAKHLPELLELKEAMGKRGMRLTKIKELTMAFQAEFNSLVPLLWDETFEIELNVTDSGLEIWATRNNTREDLLSLSGSEMKVWKMLTALTLIRLLPERLRCDTIILDELEAYLDETTKRRFVSEFLPTLGKSIANIVLVSPLDYQDSSLAPVATFTVDKKNSVSTLRKM